MGVFFEGVLLGGGDYGKQEKAKCGLSWEPASAWSNEELCNMNSTTVCSHMEARELAFFNILVSQQTVLGCELCVCDFLHKSAFFWPKPILKGGSCDLLAADNHNSWRMTPQPVLRIWAGQQQWPLHPLMLPPIIIILILCNFSLQLDCHFSTQFMSNLIYLSVLPLRKLCFHTGAIMCLFYVNVLDKLQSSMKMNSTGLFT